MNHLAAYFFNLGFSPKDVRCIEALFVPKTFQKGEFFLQEGKTSQHVAFIESGIFQYYVLHDGVEKTTYVATENSFLASLLSFLQDVPSRENIRAITQAQVWMLEKKQLKKLLNDLPAFHQFYTQLLEYQICCIDNSRFDLLMLNADQRYEKLLKDYPSLLQQVPLQLLAAMMGITPRHLSRIRTKLR